MKKAKFLGLDMSTVEILSEKEQRKVVGGSGYSGTWKCSLFPGVTYWTKNECEAQCRTITANGSRVGSCSN